MHKPWLHCMLLLLSTSVSKANGLLATVEGLTQSQIQFHSIYSLMSLPRNVDCSNGSLYFFKALLL